jgi:hypothetical protein
MTCPTDVLYYGHADQKAIQTDDEHWSVAVKLKPAARVSHAFLWQHAFLSLRHGLSTAYLMQHDQGWTLAVTFVHPHDSRLAVTIVA